MKFLYVYFSRTGNNGILAKEICNRIDCTLERIEAEADLSSMFVMMRLGIESIFGILPKIKQPKEDPSEYDLVIIGTPAWAGSLPSPALSYLKINKGKISRYAIASISGKGDNPKTIAQIRKMTGNDPVAVLEIKMPDTEKPSMDQKIDQAYLEKEFRDKIDAFAEKLKKRK